MDCDHAPDDRWDTVRLSWYQPFRTPYTVEWQVCFGNIYRQRVRVTDDDLKTTFFQYEDDETVRVENVDLRGNHVPELLVVTGSAGTFDGMTFHVIGESNGSLHEWKSPDYDAAAAKLLHSDEDFCCKDWAFYLQATDVVLARGIYRKGDGNCCPSRGGVLVWLKPGRNEFVLGNVQRISKAEYYRWISQPFCLRCVLTTPR